jgi:hypothetical protein
MPYFVAIPGRKGQPKRLPRVDENDVSANEHGEDALREQQLQQQQLQQHLLLLQQAHPVKPENNNMKANSPVPHPVDFSQPLAAALSSQKDKAARVSILGMKTFM